MTYTLDRSHRATSFTKGRQGTAITTIVVHWWGDPSTNPTFDGTVTYFAKGGNTTSAHYVVEAGRVANMVDDADTAYHAGNWGMNLRSIGIECNPKGSDADKATVAELILDLEKTHGLLTIIGHRDVINTTCPGVYYPPINVLAPWLHPHINPIQTASLEDEMFTLMKVQGQPAVYLTNGVTSRWVQDEATLTDLAYLGGKGDYSIHTPTEGFVMVGDVPVREVANANVLGVLIGPAPH